MLFLSVEEQHEIVFLHSTGPNSEKCLAIVKRDCPNDKKRKAEDGNFSAWRMESRGHSDELIVFGYKKGSAGKRKPGCPPICKGRPRA